MSGRSLPLREPWTRTGLTAWTGIAASVAAVGVLSCAARLVRGGRPCCALRQ